MPCSVQPHEKKSTTDKNLDHCHKTKTNKEISTRVCEPSKHNTNAFSTMPSSKNYPQNPHLQSFFRLIHNWRPFVCEPAQPESIGLLIPGGFQLIFENWGETAPLLAGRYPTRMENVNKHQGFCIHFLRIIITITHKKLPYSLESNCTTKQIETVQISGPNFKNSNDNNHNNNKRVRSR